MKWPVMCNWCMPGRSYPPELWAAWTDPPPAQPWLLAVLNNSCHSATPNLMRERKRERDWLVLDRLGQSSLFGQCECPNRTDTQFTTVSLNILYITYYEAIVHCKHKALDKPMLEYLDVTTHFILNLKQNIDIKNYIFVLEKICKIQKK